MANTLGVYNPIFYAQEALIHLWNALGMGPRVHLGYSAERETFERGDTINIRKPSTFTVANAPDTSGQDLSTETVAITLDQWKEVKFKLTDKELALTQNRIIDDHIAPAAYALADNIDVALSALYKDIPWYINLNATPGSVVTDITGPRKILFDNAVPLQDQEMMHYMVDSVLEQGLLGNSAFTQWQGAGSTGEQSQLRGTLGRRFGIEIFANQNVQSHTKGTASDTAIVVNGAVAKGATTVVFDAAGADTETVKKGDVIEFTGITQKYVVAADAAVSGTDLTVTIFPAAQTAIADDTTATLILDDHTANLMFHRNAFALVVAPLPMIGNELGARVATVTDPVTGISLRSRIYYVGNSSEVHVALDVLYGVKTLDANLAVRGRG